MIYARLIYGMFIQALLIACDTSITQAANTPPLEKFSTKRIQKTEQNVSILYNLYNRDTTRYTRAFQFAGKFTRHETRNLRRTVTEFSAKDREKWPYEKSSQAGKHSNSVLYYPFQSDFSTLMSPITLPMAKNKSNTHFREGNISLPRYKRSADTADAKGVKTNVPKPVLLQNYNKLKTEIENITIATVLPYIERMLFSIQRVQPAIDIAIEKVNPTLDKLNKRLIVKFRDSLCDNANSMNEAIGFYVRKEMHVLFGPCCDYAAAPIARQVGNNHLTFYHTIGSCQLPIVPNYEAYINDAGKGYECVSAHYYNSVNAKYHYGLKHHQQKRHTKK
ncbi:hypothetical protein DPMN_031161 [Dreissena polymorpha]|uniref:Uncharacterized protein n=1 Tax=Dreissena polymorpha TaxID=45954 RepID=A0A9D4M1P7_DREPO|nr:hypothetical protein DPMN_031161 [Dreissena polymorpha]